MTDVGSGTEPTSLFPGDAVECSSLSGRFHSDPADRIIRATARLGELT